MSILTSVLFVKVVLVEVVVLIEFDIFVDIEVVMVVIQGLFSPKL